MSGLDSLRIFISSYIKKLSRALHGVKRIGTVPLKELFANMNYAQFAYGKV
jgi:hypothetical protein